jgi:hypothetical protein
MELAAASGLRVGRVFLHPQLTEIALAGRVKRLFTEFARRVRAGGREPGLITHNPLAAAELLGTEIASFTVIVAPCNPKGYKMWPDQSSCEALLKSDPHRFWAADPTVGGTVALEDASAYLGGLGLTRAVIDLRYPRSSSPRATSATGGGALG